MSLPNKKEMNIYNDLCPCNSGKKIFECCFAKINTTPPGQNTGYSHPNCYAKGLKDCSAKISNEHYISKGVLDLFNSKIMEISGVSWLKDNQIKTISKNQFAAKILCKRHNESLSGLDTIATKYFEFILGKQKNQWAMIIRGTEIERWMLKLFCGYISSGILPDNQHLSSNKPISQDFLETLFYQKEIPNGRGLFFLLKKGKIQNAFGLISWKPLISEEYGLIGFSLTIDFIEMLFSFGVVKDHSYDEELTKQLIYHPESISIEDEFGYREVHFGWPEGKPIHFTGEGYSL